MTRTGPIGSKPLQGKKLHGKKMDWDQKMGSKQKTWHRLGKNGKQTTAVKNWHLTNMDWDETMASKKNKKMAPEKKESDRNWEGNNSK